MQIQIKQEVSFIGCSLIDVELKTKGADHAGGEIQIQIQIMREVQTRSGI